MALADNPDILDLLAEIRDNQKLALERQAQQLEIAEQQLQRSREQVEESIELQRQAMARMQRVFRFALPTILFCIGMIVYLVVRFF